MVEQEVIKFKREHFIRIDQDLYHYYYSFGVPGFEICLEPCAAGFDVAIYAEDRSIGSDIPSSLEPKLCTKTGDYTQIDALFGDRKDEDWNKALAIADEMLDKYIKDSDKLRELIEQRSIMKCMFCGCTDDNACPGGCSWVEFNVCSRCKDRLRGNELISGAEIKALRRRAKTMTMQEGLRLTMQGGFVPVIPMEIKSGYVVSLTIIENPPDKKQLEVFSVGARHGKPDPADSERIAFAVLGKGALPLKSLLPSSRMVHFWKRRE